MWKNIAIVGMGRAGSALAHLLQGLEFRVVAVPHRYTSPTITVEGRSFPARPLHQAVREVEVVIIATPDQAIARVAEELAGLELGSLQGVLHVSGSLSSRALDPLRCKGIGLGVLHPLQSLADVRAALQNLPGSYFTYEGDAVLEEWAARLVELAGGKFQVIPSPEAKVIYHAGACLVSNYLVVLCQLGIDCLQEAGFREAEARQALLPLMQGTLNNLAVLEPPSALTGPIARGDTGTVAAHLQALTRNLPHLLPLYTLLGREAARLARAAGRLSQAQWEEFQQIFARLPDPPEPK